MDLGELKKYLNKEVAPIRHRWRKLNSYFYKDIQRLFRFAVPEKSKVLEIGFDDGWLLNSLKPNRGVYLGVSEALNKQGQTKYPHLTFVEDSALSEIPLEEKFDYIILSNVIGAVDDIQPYFKRLHQVCNSKTKVIVTYYNYLWEPLIKLGEKIGLKQKQPVQSWLSADDIANLLDLAGFEVIKTGRRMLFPFYIPLISAFLNRFLARLPLIDRLTFWHYVVVRPRPDYQKKENYSTSVIVPARNEKGNIESIVKRLPTMGEWTELIFIEGGSTDGTLEEIKRVVAQYQNNERLRVRYDVQDGKGKGDAVRKGFALAQGDILMILDADISVDPEALPRFYNVLATGHAEYVQGSRLVYPMEKGAMRFLNLLGNKFFSLVFSWLLGQRFKDTLCGTKVIFRKDYEVLAANRKYFGDFDPFGDFDLIFGASKLSLKMAEIPVHYKERTYGSTNIQRFRHGIILIKMCVFASRKLE